MQNQLSKRPRFGALSSSENPDQLADTVKGIILGASSLVIYFGNILLHRFHFPFTIAEENVTAFAIYAGAAVSGAWTLFGLLKKGVVFLHSLWVAWRTAVNPVA